MRCLGESWRACDTNYPHVPSWTDRSDARLSRFTKEKIALAPNNPSAWNYLRGVLEHTQTPFASLTAFVQPYTAAQPPAQDVLDLENPPPSAGAELPCVNALEFLADIYEQEGGAQTAKAAQVGVKCVISCE